MSARRVLGLVIALGIVASGPAAAQLGYRVQFSYDLRGDSIVAAKPGASFTVDIVAYDQYGYGADSFAVRIPFDASKLAFVAAAKLCPDSTDLHVSPGAGFVVISAPSCGAYSYGQPVVRLTLQLLGGVIDGTIAGMQPLSFIDNGGNNRTLEFATDFVQICHASGVWGDIDDDAAVNSRDALIALSNAVGIPTGAFNVMRGDVDADGQVTSRDALLMLSNSIGLYTGGYRVAAGIADACAPQPTFPRPLYFVRNGPNPGVTGVSGLAIRAANDSAVTVPGDSADIGNYQWRPRVSPDGSSVLFICFNSSGYPVVCKAGADGSGKTELTGNFSIDQSPDWSPAGDSIVFITSNLIWVMGADGSGQRQVAGPASVTSVAWKPGSRTLAYTNVSSNGEVHTFNLDTGVDVTVFNASGLPNTYTPRFVDWNAAGDTIFFDLTLFYNAVVGAVPASGGSLSTPVNLVNAAYHPAWTDQGVFFTGYWNGYYRIVLARNDGTFAIVSRDTEQHYVPGMKRVP